MITTHYSPFDLLLLFLVSSHLLFSFAASLFLLHFHFRSSSSPSPSLCRRLHLLLRLNSLWPVRLLLVLFASLLSISELLRLPHRNPHLCQIYAISSQSFAEPAFLATLLFLLRASTDSKLSSSSSFASVFSTAVLASSPFLLLHTAYLILAPSISANLNVPYDLLLGPPSDRCSQTLFGTFLLAILGAVYVPLFISACWNAVTVVINKRLRIRLYALATVVVVALSGQLTSLALSSLWSAGSVTGQLLRAVAFGSLLVCVAAGEGILVVQPVVDALEIVAPDGGDAAMV